MYFERLCLISRYFPSRYKLAQIERRFVLVNHTDPSGRDHNGYMTGSYYVGVYGWCTPDEFVTNKQFDGPCSYAANTHFNVTVELNYSKWKTFRLTFPY